MSCDCEHKKLGGEIDRIRKLAKAYAQMEDTTVAIYSNPDGTYGFCSISVEINKPIVEYITQF